MKKLNKKEETSVNGGGSLGINNDYFNAHCGEHIGEYDMPNYIGQHFVIKYDNGPVKYEGILVRSYEEDQGCGATIRTHEFKSMDGSSTETLSGDCHTCYLYKDWYCI